MHCYHATHGVFGELAHYGSEPVKIIEMHIAIQIKISVPTTSLSSLTLQKKRDGKGLE